MGKIWNDSVYPLYLNQNILLLPLMIKFETAKLPTSF